MIKKLALVCILASTPLMFGSPAEANYGSNGGANGTGMTTNQGDYNNNYTGYGARTTATERGVDWGWLGLLGLVGLAGLRGRNRDAEPDRV